MSSVFTCYLFNTIFTKGALKFSAKLFVCPVLQSLNIIRHLLKDGQDSTILFCAHRRSSLGSKARIAELRFGVAMPAGDMRRICGATGKLRTYGI